MPEVGEVVAGYRIDGLIARGGMGEIYEAMQLSLQRRVAVKFIAPELTGDVAFRERFRREARTAAAIDHPSILPIYDTQETDDGRLLIAMRLVQGQDLGSYLSAHGPLEAHEAVTLLKPIAEALDAAHEAGLVHRDVKPANVLLEPRGNGSLTAFLTDFGLAKSASSTSRHTRTGKIVGTVDFMAPEQARGGTGLDGRVDVYAFGCLMYCALTGEPPYRRESEMATMVAHVNEPVPVPSHAVGGVPEAMDMVVGRAMAKDPSRRARSAGALMRWAEAQLGPPPQPATAETLVRDATLIGAAPSSGASPSTGWLLALNTAVLACLWAAAYAIGSNL
jgi:serine/threonine-protein kinase